MSKWTHLWFFRKWLPERKGQLCRVLARGNGGEARVECWSEGPFGEPFKGISYSHAPRNVLVEFQDGFKVVSTRFCVRRVKPKKNRPAREDAGRSR